jgi:hypothetical protein
MSLADYIGIAVALVVAVYTYRWRKPSRRKVNRFVRRRSDSTVHVPRVTAWDRARRYYGPSHGR